MTKEEIEFIARCIGNGIHCETCPLKSRCTNIHGNTCYGIWNNYLSAQYPEPKGELLAKPLTVGMLIEMLQNGWPQTWEIACKIIEFKDIQREANLMGIAIKENEVSKALIKLNQIDRTIGINTKSIRDAIRDVTRDRLAKGFVDSIKEGENV